MAKTHKVSFTARKTVSKPVRVEFRTSKGRVSFIANKTVSKPVKVEFRARKKP